MHVYYRKDGREDYQKEENRITYTSAFQTKVDHLEHFGMHFPSEAKFWFCLSTYINKNVLSHHSFAFCFENSLDISSIEFKVVRNK